MSRIGNLPVTVPSGVTVTDNGGNITVKGAKGELTQDYRDEVSFNIEKGQVVISRKDESKTARSMHGLYRSLLNNMVVGVSEGFSKSLLVFGVGYRAEVQGQSVLFSLGYSTQIEYQVPEGVTVTSEGNNPIKVTVSGASKQLVGQVAAEMRKLRPVEPYKGKGIQYEGEKILRKVGKSGVK